MLHARAGSPVPHTEAVPPACSAFHFPCKHEESSPLAVLSLSLSPALPPAPCDSAPRRARLDPVPGGAGRAAGGGGPCPGGLCSSSSGQAAPRRGTGKGTEPSLTASPAPGERLPGGIPAPPSRFSPWPPPARAPSPLASPPLTAGGDVPWPPRDASALRPRTKRHHDEAAPPVTASFCDTASPRAQSQTLPCGFPVPWKSGSHRAVLSTPPAHSPQPTPSRVRVFTASLCLLPSRRFAPRAHGMLHHAANPQLRGTEVRKTKVKLLFQGNKKKVKPASPTPEKTMPRPGLICHTLRREKEGIPVIMLVSAQPLLLNHKLLLAAQTMEM